MGISCESRVVFPWIYYIRPYLKWCRSGVNQSANEWFLYVPQCFEVVVCAFSALRYISTPLSFHNLLSPLFQGVPGFLCLHNPLQFSITFQWSGVNPGVIWCPTQSFGVKLQNLDLPVQAMKALKFLTLGRLVIDIHRGSYISMSHNILDDF